MKADIVIARSAQRDEATQARHSEPGTHKSDTRAAVLTLIVFATLIRLGFAWALGLGVDESYMVATGRQLRWSYFDHPPASWWLQWAGAHLFGTEAPLAVRTPFILCFALSTWLMYPPDHRRRE